MKRLMCAAIALALCVGVPAAAFAEGAASTEVTDIQTEDVEIAETTSEPSAGGDATVATPRSSGSSSPVWRVLPTTADETSLVVPAALAGAAALCAAGAAALREREQSA